MSGTMHDPEETGRREHPRVERPQGKRAHPDRRPWLAALLMIAGMIVYIVSDDFTIRLQRRPPQSAIPGSCRGAASIMPMPLWIGCVQASRSHEDGFRRA
jgi:hypothetical protein